MRKDKIEELKRIRDELYELGLIIEDDMRYYRMKRLIKENQKIKDTTELVFLDITESLSEEESTKLSYYKMDDYDLYDKFYDGEYEMIYLPLEDIVICDLVNSRAKQHAKKHKLYHESNLEKHCLIYKSELIELLEENDLMMKEEQVEFYNKTVKYINTIEQRNNKKVLKK